MPLALLIPPPTRLHPFDLAVVAFYLVAITLFGLRFRPKKTASGSETRSTLRSYFLADNTIPWWAIALSIVSAETSTLTIISIPGVAFAGDFGFLQVVLGYLVGRMVVALLFLPRYFSGSMLTAYQLIDRRFGPVLHKVTAGLFLLTRAAAEGVRVFAISIVVGIAIGTGDVLSIAIISALTLLYTFEGGLAAVIWTDVVQMGLYVAGTLVAVYTLGTHTPGGWTHIHSVAAAEGKFQLFNFAFNLTQNYTFWAGLIGGTFLTMASHGTDQLMVQRMLAARNLRAARIALLSSGAVILVQFTLFLLIGAGLFVFYGAGAQTPPPGTAHTSSLIARPGIPSASASPAPASQPPAISPDRLFPTFIVTQMPVGVAGLLIAAILAAAMSNLSAALNSLSSTTVVDFYMHWRPAATSRERTILSRASTVFWAVLLFAIAVYSIQVGGKGHVVEIGLSIASVAYGALLGVFLLGTLTDFVTQTGAILGMICGFSLNLAMWLQTAPIVLLHMPLNLSRALGISANPIFQLPQAIDLTLPKIAFTWYVPIGAAFTFAVGALASLIFRKQSRPRTKGIAVAVLLASAFIQAHSIQAQTPRHIQADKTQAQNPSPQQPASLTASPLVSTQSAISPSSQATSSTYDFGPVDALINQAIAQKKLPGAVVFIGHAGKVVYRHAYGNRALEPAVEPMTEDTLFDMASLSKVLVTFSAILQLYELHKLELDAPVSRYLPAFAANGKQNVTVRELFTHYSGLPEDVDLKDSWGLAAPDKAEGIRRALASGPYGPPGKTFKYSDINFITLGALVETLSGEPLDLYARKQIFLPLGMSSTGYHSYDKTCGPATRIGAAIEPGPRPIGRIGVACAPGTWSPYALDPNTAPTAHDDEGSAATNPDFDHLLRGSVHDPTTRRMGGVAGHAGVFSTAADTALFAQALLDKLTANTGPFPLTQATLKIATLPNEPAQAHADATIFTPSGETTKGVASRGLGWDINSPFSRPRGTIFPITVRSHTGSFGHTGFTGTSLWLDPTTNTYVILLANAIHPRVGAPLSSLRGEVATAAAKALHLQPLPLHTDVDPSSSGLHQPASELRSRCSEGAICDTFGAHPSAQNDSKGTPSNPAARPDSTNPRSPPTLTGIDVLEQTHFAAFAGAIARRGPIHIGLLANAASLDSQGHRTADILLHTLPNVTLTTLFTPEHGLSAAQDTEHLAPEVDAATHLPVVSLYGSNASGHHPTGIEFANIDVLVVDLQDAGVRFWTYETLVGYLRETLAISPTELLILDRPNPLGGLAVQGQTSEGPQGQDYTNYMPIPLRHGLTLGELARYFDGQTNLCKDSYCAPLTVIPMQHWNRSQFFNDTGLTWTPPSPNLRTPRAAILYPGVGLIEQTNISVGRGTSTPFEHIGAPYLDPNTFAAYLTARHIPGITFTPTSFTIAETPEHYPSHGQTIPGIHLEVTDPTALDSPELGIELLAALHHLYPKDFRLERARRLLANPDVLAALTRGDDPRDIAASWQPALEAFRARRKPYLLYTAP